MRKWIEILRRMFPKRTWAFGLVLLLTGCYTERTAQRQVDKAHHRYPIIPAKYCADKFDPVDSVSVVTEYIQGADIVHTDTVHSMDSLIVTRYITRTITKVDTLRDTKYVQTENKAKIKVAEGTIAKQATEIAELTASRSTWRNWAIWLAVIIGLWVVYKVVRIFIKTKSKMVGI